METGGRKLYLLLSFPSTMWCVLVHSLSLVGSQPTSWKCSRTGVTVLELSRDISLTHSFLMSVWHVFAFMRMCVCVYACLHMCVCVCVCVRERERESELAIFCLMEHVSYLHHDCQDDEAIRWQCREPIFLNNKQTDKRPNPSCFCQRTR